MHASKKAVVLTGAGISTPSGIPDFRSPGSGLWQDIDPFRVISLSAFRQDAAIFYDWLHPLAVRMLTAKPNAAHHALAQMEEKGFIMAVMTQNIDGLHQAAGSKKVLELHGSLETMICLNCRRRSDFGLFREAFIESRRLPECPSCRAVLKPEIVFFEEMLPMDIWAESERLCSNADLILVMGSSLSVVPANQLPLTALRNGARLAFLNREATPLDDAADCIITGDIEKVLPRLLIALEPEV